MAYPLEFKEKVKGFRREGLSINELSQKFNLSKGTLSLWLRDVEVCEQGQQRLRARLEEGRRYFIEQGSSRSRKSYQNVRDDAYQQGLNSNPSLMDAVAVGLYMGDGTKRSTDSNPSWSFSNADRNHVRIQLEWAIRAGQPKGRFRARIQVHPRDAVSDQDIKEFWSDVGIPVENIRITRLRSPSSKKKTNRATPYGTCYLHPQKNGVRLFCYYKGQRDEILRRYGLMV